MHYNGLFENRTHASGKFNYNTYLCTIPKDFSLVTPHWHSELELIVIKKGVGIVWVDLQCYKVVAGDIIFVQSGGIHSIEQYQEETMEYENIFFPLSLLEGKKEDGCTGKYLEPFAQGKYKCPTHISSSEPYHHQVWSHVERLDSQNKIKAFGYELFIKSELLALFATLVTQGKIVSKKEPTQVVDKVKEIVDYIDTRYNQPITVEQVAKYVGFSTSHFMRFFRENMGTTMVDYLTTFRLEKASRLLLQTDKTVLAISLDCGFSNLSYFNRVFKRKYRKTPSAYRR